MISPATPFDPNNDDPNIQSCTTKLGILLPDLNIELLCGVDNVKKFWVFHGIGVAILRYFYSISPFREYEISIARGTP